MKRLDRYWWKWTWHCALGELLGILAATGIALGLNNLIGEPVTLLQKLVVLLAMMGAGAIEGSLLGWMQWRVLRERLPLMPAPEWIGWTMAVAVLGWFLGMLPSLFFIAPAPEIPASAAAGPWESPWLLALLTVSMGLVVGALFGWFQWFALKNYIAGAGRWILANALGWGLGLGWIYLAASWPDEHTPLPLVLGLGIAGGILAGLSVGAVTGIYLNQLTPPAAHRQ